MLVAETDSAAGAVEATVTSADMLESLRGSIRATVRPLTSQHCISPRLTWG